MTTRQRDGEERYSAMPPSVDRLPVSELDAVRGGAGATGHSAKRKPRAGDSAVELENLCHDLRQYVSAGLLLSKMPGDEDLDPAVFERLQLLHQQFAHIADLIAVARGELVPRRWELDLASLVQDGVKLVQLTHGVNIEVDVANRPVAYGDPVLTRRALVNVLDNASRAAGQDGKVTVTLGDDATTAWVDVVDTGLGFGQIESGSGRGLPIVYAAVRASGGRLEISSGPGPGTQVRIILPNQLDGEQVS